MNRRDLIRNLIAGTGAIYIQSPFLKAYAEAHGTTVPGSVVPDVHSMLSEITETIIPETTTPGASTPGAKTLKLAESCIRMIDDCYDQKSQALLISGIKRTNEIALADYKKDFDKCEKSEREAILQKMADSPPGPDKAFITMIKALTIRVYNNSEYVMTNINNYVQAPGFYHGCVPINSKK